ncbi:carboxymuconolactone decarboxylase family protein [Leptolyngbya sp. FACHB-261]|uniref:carboxymuconolactone decarboxylase family protein n=1 Tax=Leptolyngbya sp. FACHB-261 TaxID=2692806 RepID=UPI00168765FA|nr:carboxymuconolactone decarboxylase family protein [Leptolyngbya sp. FACHB-261]MBD2103761.1 carboxymuconolactone decarboxylase family protein [Leptolyngbya sp. FACHB-261]
MTQPNQTPVNAQTQTRYERGLKKLAEVDGKIGEEVVSRLGDLGRYIVEFAFGDIYNREGLNLREREIATIAMLTAMGGREPQLRVHIGAGLHVGLAPEEIEEIILQTVPYAGFPTAINALHILQDIVQEVTQNSQ